MTVSFTVCIGVNIYSQKCWEKWTRNMTRNDIIYYVILTRLSEGMCVWDFRSLWMELKSRKFGRYVK